MNDTDGWIIFVAVTLFTLAAGFLFGIGIAAIT